MLSRKHRLERKHFKEIFDRGTMFRGRYFVLRVIRGPEMMGKFGFSVSKKAFKNASDRNKVRRRGYAALEELYKKKPLLKLNGLFSMGKPQKMPAYKNIASDVFSLLAKAGVL